MLSLQSSALMIVFLPLLAALVVGLGGKSISRFGAHTLTIAAMTLSLSLSLLLSYQFFRGDIKPLSFNLYTWATIKDCNFSVGFLIDELTAVMLSVVAFISWIVHLYSMGYMKKDPGYQRFFCYISLFTFGMFMLISANNFVQLYFGWEMVGLVSYLLIGFWFHQESAVFANLKAFIVNRVGDFGFIIGIATIFYCFGVLDYQTIFEKISFVTETRVQFGMNFSVSAITLICFGLFIGAMGKSAQIPLHVWLPDSMEGPTPISALIHAATMVTAGVFMLARLSPIFEYSEVVLNIILSIGVLTAVLMGLVGIVQNDIKRIIAYSTLSQLGYMIAAMGVSAYSIGIFHLVTHAFFKALLFLGAGVVILSQDHEQDIWQMGNLRKALPITYYTMLVASLALIGFPFFSGFYSKDLIIEAVQHSNLPAATWGYYGVLGAVFITALYTFRLLFVVFHRKTPAKVILAVPNIMPVCLLLLAVPTVLSGFMLFQPFLGGYFGHAMVIRSEHQAFLSQNAIALGIAGFYSKTFFLGVLGIIASFVVYLKYPQVPLLLQKKFAFCYRILQQKFGFDALYLGFLVPFVQALGLKAWHVGDETCIDGVGVKGTALSVKHLAIRLRQWQTGYLYHYVFIMVLGLLALVLWVVFCENVANFK
jgi:NADH-quinone oxidoreductase subunit L